MSMEGKLLIGLAVTVVLIVAVPIIGIIWFDAHNECVSWHTELRTSPGVGIAMPNSPVVITSGSTVYEAQVCDEWRKKP